MADHSIDLRRRLVEAYRSKKSGTYAVTAALFGVGEAPRTILEAIARKSAGAIIKSAASPAAKGLKACQLRRSPIALGAIEIRRYCMIVHMRTTPR
jgi:hypothetical protein